MSTLDHLREERRRQGMRFANASRGHRERELDLYRKLDELVKLNEARASELAA